MLSTTYLLLAAFASLISASCDTHSPAFPLPKLNAKQAEIRRVYSIIKSEITQALKDFGSADISYSVAVTSQSDTLFELHHTATDKDEKRPGTSHVNGKSVYRIASNTKPFTVLALLQLQKQGKLNFDDPVNKYLPELEKDKTGSLPWKDITIRTLASQLSGIPRNLGTVDLSDTQRWKALGLPEVNHNDGFVVCDSIWNYTRACTKDDLYGFLRKAEPLFAPKQQSTYSNINFVLLGQVIEKITGGTYQDYIKKNILDDLDMKSSTFLPAKDDVAVLPKGQSHSFDTPFGLQDPTGGMYSSSDDMMKWARYILTSYNGLSPVINWLQPQSFATGMKSFYGMPWEIFRTDEILSYTKRPVTFVTKGGGWPGYTSVVSVVPEYGIGFVVLVGSSEDFGGFQARVAGIVGQRTVETVDAIAQQQVGETRVGTYTAPEDLGVDSSITISHSDVKGLHISSWTSRSMDVLKGYRNVLSNLDEDVPFHLQLVPTLLFKNETQQAGEIWRILPIQGPNPKYPEGKGPLNKDFCITNLDVMAYGGKSLEEVVFWSHGKSKVFDEVELTGWRIKLKRTDEASPLERVRKLAHDGAVTGQEVLRDWFHGAKQDL